ncbi:MAG: glycerate kinase [Lentisphaeria bacterium]|nr:glycerate kinase [Lentisphaeria bacterium]
MKIIIAPDKYKGNMTSPELCEIIRHEFLAEMPDAEIISIPLADGGDGTTEALTAAHHGELRKITVRGPLGQPAEAVLGVFDSGRSAVLEMASASGLALLKNTGLDPFRADTFGTGELIRAALDGGAQSLTIGIGGSATVDGGTGMARALGYRFLDAEGKELPSGPEHLTRLDSIDPSKVDPRLFQAKISVACDVTNPLLGAQGTVAVYGPQKGVTAETAPKLEQAMARLAEVWKKQNMIDSTDRPGDGAAGGLGAGLRAFCHAELTSGAKLIMQAAGLEKQLKGADLLITGEGCTDSQTDAGKLCGEVALTARKYGVPVLLLSGALKGDPSKFSRTFDYAFSTSTGAHANLAEAIRMGRSDLTFTARNLARIFKRGVR